MRHVTARLISEISRQKILLLFVAVFYSLMLIPHFYPKIGESFYYFIYTIGLAGTLVGVIVSLLTLSFIGIIALIRHKQLSNRQFALSAFLLTTIVIILSVVTIGHFVPHNLPTGSDLLSFDAILWQSDDGKSLDENTMTTRQKMLKSAIDKIISGGTRDSILLSLGSPTETDYFKNTGRDIIYYLGPERDSFFGIDSEWLLIWFDEQGKVKNYQITAD